MLTFSLGGDTIRPVKSPVYQFGYIVKHNAKVGILPGATLLLDTGVIFAHGPSDVLDVSLTANLITKTLQLTKFSVDVHPDRQSNVSDQNKTLKLHIKNNAAGIRYINVGENVCEVVSVNRITLYKITILEATPQPTQTELLALDIATAGTAEADKALVLDSSANITGINILETDQLGINQPTPSSQIHIKQSADDTTGGLRFEESADTNYWGMFMAAADNLQFHYNGTNLGFVNTAGTDIAMNFTGQHRSSTSNATINSNPENYIGMIVSTTGNYKNLNNSALSVNDAVPEVDLTAADNDKAVFGVISAKEDENEDRTYQTGIFATYFDKESGDERLFINSLGEGMVWVCDKGGAFTNGDLITSSAAAGYGQLQADDLLHNYTVGKITQSCDFSTPEKYVDLTGAEVDQATYDADPINHYKCNFVGCVYYCG